MCINWGVFNNKKCPIFLFDPYQRAEILQKISVTFLAMKFEEKLLLRFTDLYKGDFMVLVRSSIAIHKLQILPIFFAVVLNFSDFRFVCFFEQSKYILFDKSVATHVAKKKEKVVFLYKKRTKHQFCVNFFSQRLERELTLSDI